MDLNIPKVYNKSVTGVEWGYIGVDNKVISCDYKQQQHENNYNENNYYYDENDTDNHHKDEEYFYENYSNNKNNEYFDENNNSTRMEILIKEAERISKKKHTM